MENTNLLNGFYCCSSCKLPLFERNKKFDSRTGFPSFWDSYEKSVEKKLLQTYGRERIQLLCKTCGLHLGHLFPNKNTPSGKRYCINKASIELMKEKE
ncbi:peptide-methionine (R)-S-oxide reductase [Nafulsella turpanensis]|uniref:peptide-methionine (R)-S-oxide reductase n=1 Tax=Nafulsella turpanensis TaxID=1265690 RepID=UPI0009DA8515|nr:peptide-methionine (R)-S-oxide reductase [Nafulsella turpanensis]